MKFDYVFSGPSFLRIGPSKPEESEYVTISIDCLNQFRDIIKSLDSTIQLEMSILFNAYTEEVVGNWILDNNKYGFESVYSDSGGLQVVTLGKTITDEVKQKVYKTQSRSDFAMCFDEIPCRIREGADKTNSRALVHSRVYYPEEMIACAIKTANNIKEQIEILVKLNSNAKVFYIIQGNTEDDMVEWFKQGIAVLDNWHWDHIAGLAFGSVCMGNGIQESCDMMAAYHRIRKLYTDEYTKNHIHFLGVGSANRLMPLIYLMKSGFLDDKVRVSFDSTSFGVNHVMGRFLDTTGQLSRADVKNFSKMFGDIFDTFETTFRKYKPTVDRDEIIDHFIKYSRSVSDTINFAPEKNRDIIRTTCTLAICYQLIGFIKQLKEIHDTNGEIKRKSQANTMAMYNLQFIKTLTDYNEWKKVNLSWYNNSTTRVYRQVANDKVNYFDIAKPIITEKKKVVKTTTSSKSNATPLDINSFFN